MMIKRSPDIRSSEITDWNLYLNRREHPGSDGTASVAAAGLKSSNSPPSDAWERGKMQNHGVTVKLIDLEVPPEVVTDTLQVPGDIGIYAIGHGSAE